MGFCVKREKHPLAESYSWCLQQHGYVSDDSPVEGHISCVSEAAWGGWLRHRYLRQLEWEESTALTWGTKRYLSETSLNLLFWSYFSSTQLDLFTCPESFSPMCINLTIFTHLLFIPMGETNLDEVANKHRPRQVKLHHEVYSNSWRDKSLQRDYIDNPPYDSQESCLIWENI